MPEVKKKRSREDRRIARDKRLSELQEREAAVQEKACALAGTVGSESVRLCKFASVPVDIAMLSSNNVTLFLKNKVCRVRKGDTVLLTCVSTGKQGNAYIILHNGQVVYAIADSDGRAFSNLNSEDRADDVILTAPDEVIGQIVCIIPD